MRAKRRAIKPMVAGCESRELLSSLALHLPAAVIRKATAIKVIPLNGKISGRYVQTTVNPDVGSVLVLNGSGNVSGFGKAYVSGSVGSVGFIANGTARGTLTLAGPRGTITLSLTGAVAQNGPASLPSQFTFRILVGTGKFWKAHDQGTATLTLSPATSTSPSTLVTNGKFALSLKSYPVPVA